MFRSRGAWASGGMLLGLIVGLNVSGVWPQIPVHAVATHGEGSFAICTAPVDEDVEGIFFLDYLTGDLKGAVLNVQTGRFNAFYEYNVLADLQVKGVKNPHYLMVSGVANLRHAVQSGNLQPGRAVVYVAELTSGQVAAYGIPWMQSRANAGVAQKGALVMLDKLKFRTTPVRETEDE